MATEFVNKATGSFSISGTNYNVESNIVTAELLLSITMVKSQSLLIVNSGDTQTYTIVITNPNIFTVDNFAFSDIIPAGMSYVTGTFKINGTVVTPTISGNTISRTINPLAIGVTTVTFNCNVS